MPRPGHMQEPEARKEHRPRRRNAPNRQRKAPEAKETAAGYCRCVR